MMFRTAQLCKVLGILIGVKFILGLTLFYFSRHVYRGDVVHAKHFSLKVDTRKAPSKERLDELVQKELPSLPLQYLLANEGRGFALNDSCAQYPTFNDIEFQNDYWQVARNGKKIYYLFGAYYDKRPSVEEAPVIRLLSMINEIKNDYPPMFCQFWYKDKPQPMIVPVTDYKTIWYDVWGNTPHHIYPTVMTCKTPDGEYRKQVPITVSVVADECAMAANNLNVYYDLPPTPTPSTATRKADKPTSASSKSSSSSSAEPKLRFAVCVKTMDFPYVDMSYRIVEWLELMRLLGAEKVTFYNAQVHPNITRVLRHYESTGFVQNRVISLARGEPHSMKHFHHFALANDNLNRFLNEIIPYNDCFYRSLYQYDYIGVFDIDEVIMPLGNLTNWTQLIKTAKAVLKKKDCKDWVSYCFRNIYYPRYPEKPPHYPNLPAYFYMMQHVKRVAEHLDENSAIKCLHSTSHAVSLHNHFPLAWTGKCGPLSVPVNFGQMQHYREPDIEATLQNPVLDDNIWRFSDPLINRTSAMYKELGILQENESEYK